MSYTICLYAIDPKGVRSVVRTLDYATNAEFLKSRDELRNQAARWAHQSPHVMPGHRFEVE